MTPTAAPIAARWMSVSRAASILGATPSTVRRWCAEGHAPARQTGPRGHWRISREWVAAQADAARPRIERPRRRIVIPE